MNNKKFDWIKGIPYPTAALDVNTSMRAIIKKTFGSGLTFASQ